MNNDSANRLLMALLSYSDENEWIEFKADNTQDRTIGERLSALSNMAALEERSFGYLVYGVADKTHEVVGTTFNFYGDKIGNSSLKPWVESLIEPRMSILPIEAFIQGKRAVILRVPAAKERKTTFQGEAYCRVGEATKPLSSRPDLEQRLYSVLQREKFERQIALQGCSEEQVFALLDLPSYYDACHMLLPQKSEMLRKFIEEDFIRLEDDGDYSITYLGALCFAKKLSAFPHLLHKIPRFVAYQETNRLNGLSEVIFDKGYAIIFDFIIQTIQLHYRREEFQGPFRVNMDPYSEIALREATANALIHGDLFASGSGPLIEAFPNRLEFSNPGALRFDADRILDVSPDATNEGLADFMHRLGIGDERGSGFDKMLLEAERHHAPSPLIEESPNGIRLVLFPHVPYENENAYDVQRDIYFHCCLCYLNRTPMTNASLRERFGVGEEKRVELSKRIRTLVDLGKIKVVEGSARKNMEYVPYWA